ncbi:hypothetical protein C0Q70_01423 [Pomacea canaliculata]|uniref:Netrin receptor UNC5A-D-like N-terminal domain-containing protein n=1 Tax=Pomacea canaliculata TaxID=400727 RepID=A0A2T7PZH7_POMCA|nr:hypothetical protein C0Q70_01423 [Pomacea canaliculata]
MNTGAAALCVKKRGAQAAGDFPFGSSDPLNQGLPEWRQQPEANYYVVRTKPAVITCRATPAIQITFTCAGSQVPVKQYTNLELMDPVTGRKTLQSSIEVTRDEVEDYYGEDGYWCECFAWNTVQGSSNPQHVKSTRALIEAACAERSSHRLATGKAVKQVFIKQGGYLQPRPRSPDSDWFVGIFQKSGNGKVCGDELRTEEPVETAMAAIAT